MIKNIIYIIVLMFISSCAKEHTSVTNKEDIKDKVIFDKAIKFSKEKKYTEAIENFKRINEEYPYSEFSSSAKIFNAYLNFELNKLDEAIILVSDYINMDPFGKFSDYAHYLLGMCYYVQISEPDRDSDFTKKAIERFGILIKTFPESNFSKDAKFKIQFLHNYMAKKEFNVAMFYLKKNAPTPAIKRFSKILKEYEGSSIIPQTLYRIAESFLMLGLESEAEKSMKLLSINFPESKWTVELKNLLNKKHIVKKQKKSLFQRIFN